MVKNFFSKNAAQREIFFNIGQYFLVFWEKVVSIWSVFWEKVVSIVVSILTFFFTDHSCPPPTPLIALVGPFVPPFVFKYLGNCSLNLSNFLHEVFAP